MTTIHGGKFGDYNVKSTGVNWNDGINVSEMTDASKDLPMNQTVAALLSFFGSEVADMSLGDLQEGALETIAKDFQETDADKLKAKMGEILKRLAEMKAAGTTLKSDIEALEAKIAAELEKESPDKAQVEKDQAALRSKKEALEQTGKFMKALAEKAFKASQQAQGKPSGTKHSAYNVTGVKDALEQLEKQSEAAKDKAEAFIKKGAEQSEAAKKPGSGATVSFGGGKAAKGAGDGDGAKPGAPATPGAPKGGGKAGTNPTGDGLFGNQGSTGKTALNPLAAFQNDYVNSMIDDGMDDINKSQLQSQKMMMLFFILARAAMSGDLGAMYQFMRFIGHIINKDKALQNVHMAKKLIELQNQSRMLTKKLVDTKSRDENDPSVADGYAKLVEETKAEQGVLATEQKLIAGMLEEMSQVSEMMTGMVKSLLDARGRELQMISVWR